MFTDSNALTPKTNRLRATIIDCGETYMIILLETNEIDAKKHFVHTWIDIRDQITEKLSNHKLQVIETRNSLISDKLIVNIGWHTPKPFDFFVGQEIEFSFIKHISDIPVIKDSFELILYI